MKQSQIVVVKMLMISMIMMMINMMMINKTRWMGKPEETQNNIEPLEQRDPTQEHEDDHVSLSSVESNPSNVLQTEKYEDVDGKNEKSEDEQKRQASATSLAEYIDLQQNIADESNTRNVLATEVGDDDYGNNKVSEDEEGRRVNFKLSGRVSRPSAKYTLQQCHLQSKQDQEEAYTKGNSMIIAQINFFINTGI